MDAKNVFQAALDLAGLKFDWDSYGAIPVREQAIHAVCEFAVEHLEQEAREEAFVVPTQHGGIQLEWHRESLDLEIEWDADGSFSSVFRKDELGRLPDLEFERPDTETQILASYAISAVAELASGKA